MSASHSGGRDTAVSRAGMERKISQRLASSGKITLPAVPGMLEDYVQRCVAIFAANGRPFTAEETQHLRGAISSQLDKAFADSHRSSIIVTYEAGVAEALSYMVYADASSIEQVYDHWVATREPPFFGAHPDALACNVAATLGEPRLSPILDIGAGTGRNALALARRGHPVDAVEINAKFSGIMTASAQRENLPVNVIQGSLEAVARRLGKNHAMVLSSEVVPDFRSTGQLRQLLTLAEGCLRPGGVLVFNAFVTRPHYAPDDASRQFAQQMYSAFFTRDELAAAMSGLPFQPVLDESTHDYEKAHLPPEAWPPTAWYVDWSQGRNVFDLTREDCPVELRWLVYRKTGQATQ